MEAKRGGRPPSAGGRPASAGPGGRTVAVEEGGAGGGGWGAGVGEALESFGSGSWLQVHLAEFIYLLVLEIQLPQKIVNILFIITS